MYDPFFQHQRPYNKVIQKVLYSDEIMKNYGKLAIFSQPVDKSNFEMKMPTQNEIKKAGASQSANMKGTRQIQSASNKERERSMGISGVQGGI